MPIQKHDRRYDVLVLGATGYTGRLTVQQICERLPTTLKWAVAGRSESKLRGVVDDCRQVHPDRLLPAVETANLNDELQLRSLVKKTKVLITTVGPYSLYGEPVFKACAETGTHYLDVTGEFPWVLRMIEKYETAAKTSGAIMLPQIGIESAPADLCTWLMAKSIREELGCGTGEVSMCIQNLKSSPSGGTLATALSIFDVFSLKELAAAAKPYASSPIPHPEPARPRSSLASFLFGVRHVPHLGLVTTSVAGSTDASTVERTWGLLSETESRRGEFYGPRFVWAEYFRTRNLLSGVAVHWALAVGATLLALTPPFRWLIEKFVFRPGEGPELEDAKNELIEYRGVATPDTQPASQKRVICRAHYEGSMYYMTGMFLAQAALTLLEDDVALGGGIYTPACLGQGFVDRCNAAGFKTDVRLVDH
ncbi:Saccharopine dehydrogenase-domain-containing protein [Stachybotrys elegans]|uniref:Saccharopine dehydrogenase-domain-containing protein n=1 Tax=Stachybotrys elegans TaxID=80388 RepID=A0A8K0T4D0_9HYPO|nr:Saccharopine dehydrogenase-domain-containing protein [Stachybotrys elegans]